MLETFASVPRMRILDLITTKPTKIFNIAKEVGLTPVTVRFHLQELLRLGLVEEVEERGSVGRPKALYRATGKRAEIAFPARNYMQLSDVLMVVLTSFPDQPRIHMRLRDAARNLFQRGKRSNPENGREELGSG